MPWLLGSGAYRPFIERALLTIAALIVFFAVILQSSWLKNRSSLMLMMAKNGPYSLR